MKNEKREIMTLLPKPLQKKSNRIAAYCRVSSQQDEQLHSLTAQVTYYENLLSQSDDCEFAGIYADTGISGTRTKNRAQFLQLIEDCRAGKVDGII
ncbi:MAG: recombinase family protein, partial [Eubacteriales bacterium]|nr:recombinase family protein [Eubacteriales bacterium]